MRPTTKAERAFARELRNNPTPAERLIWAFFKARQVGGHKINRQYTLFVERADGSEQKMILDFYCAALRIGIEIDGGYHFTPAQQLKDQERDALLASQQIRVIRFTNQQVLQYPEETRQQLAAIFDNL